MDILDQYLSMCEKAPRLLEGWNNGDLYTYRIDKPGCPFNYTDVCMCHYCKDRPKQGAIRVYRQDQLQQMLGKETQLGVIGLEDTSDTDEVFSLDWPARFIRGELSWEQIWLAFVMRKRHDKIWNGHEWVPIE